MLYLNMVEHFETTSDVEGLEHTEGMIHVYPTPPNMESPNCPDEVLRYDLVTIDTSPDPTTIGMNGWQRLVGHRAHWDNTDWRVTDVQPIESGDSCFLVIERLDDE